MGRNNIASVVFKYLQKIGIKVTYSSLFDELMKHPNYPSFYAISEVLNNWLIPNAAYRVEFSNLSKVPTPFLAHLSKRDDGLVLIEHIDQNEVIITDHQYDNKKYPLEFFKAYYAGEILVAEAEEQSGELNYKGKKTAELVNNVRIPFVICVAVILLITGLIVHTSILTTFNLQYYLLYLIKATGIFIAILLLIQSQDANNPFVHRLCSVGKNMNCNAILSSSAAKFYGLTWSEAGFFYFSGTFLVLLFNSDSTGVMRLLLYLNFLCLPYTFYSIYYQWIVAKQWCLFCCAIQVLFWLEFIDLIPSLFKTTTFPGISTLSDVVIELTVPILGWIFVKTFILKYKEAAELKLQLQRFKYNPDLFSIKIEGAPKHHLLDDESTITIGNKSAKTIITMVTNPYCQPCALAHRALDEWLHYREDIKIQFIVSTKNDMASPKTNVLNHWLALDKCGGQSLRAALNDWYDQEKKDYDTWAKKYPVDEKNINIDPLVLKKQQDWCDMAKIEGTPTIFINGRQLPKMYRAEDIKYLV